MGNFNRRDDRGGDRGGFRPRREVTMHKATCSNCGQTCEVPFRPTGDKPVYCNNCFGKMRDAEGGGRDRFPRNDFGGGAPRQNFDNNRGGRDGGNADVVRELQALSGKLDRILRAIEKPVTLAAPVVATADAKKPATLKQAVKNAVNPKKKK